MVILKVYMYMEIYIYIYVGTNPIDNSSKYIETIIILIKPKQSRTLLVYQRFKLILLYHVFTAESCTY